LNIKHLFHQPVSEHSEQINDINIGDISLF
jgi:hypothetical protein